MKYSTKLVDVLSGYLMLIYINWFKLILQENGRIIQSIGTPYRGTPLAGILAAIGHVFGIGCGEIYDLTYEGAERWLHCIPMEKQAEVYFYTTQVCLISNGDDC